MNIRQKRLSNSIAKLIAEIIQFELHDPDLGLITISDVTVSSDLALAKVYVMITGDEKLKERSLKALDNSRGFIRKRLAQQLTTYTAPKIQFYYDDTLDKAQRIDELLKAGKATD